MALYLEEQSISLPVLKNGVTEIGDLWNCHQNSAVGQTLFSAEINSEDIAAIPTSFSAYTANHVQGTEDNAKSLYVKGEIKAGLLGGLLEIGVKVLFDKDDSRRADEEEFVITYRQETFRIKLRSSARDKINEKVLDQLLSGKMKASHLVGEIILGGEATASVKVSDLHTNHKLEVSGEITGTISIVIMSVTVTAGAGLSETEKKDQHQTRISLQSIPPVKSKPRSLPELVQVIETLPGLIAKENHFRDIFPNLLITGVPIKFRLVPLKDFVDLETSRLYKQMSDDMLSNLISLLSTAKDILDTEFIKSKVLQKGPQLLKILEDAQSPLSMEISAEEASLRKKCALFQSRAMGCLKLYSMGESKASDLLNITREFEKEANLPGLILKVQDYVRKGKSDYHGLRLKEHNESFIYFTNAESVSDWLASGRKIKILLSTKYENGQSGIFFKLDRLSESLTKKGIEIALVAPSISRDFSLLLKIHHKETKYTGIKEISFALQVISVALGCLDAPVSFRFYSVLASFSGVHLPFSEDSQFRDLGNLISILQDTASIAICETPLRLREHISENDGQWKFVFLIDAVNSLVDGFQCFKTLKKLIDRDLPKLECSFIVGSCLQDQFLDAPSIIAFKDGKIEAICFDNLDVLILIEGIKSKSPELLHLVSLAGLGDNIDFYPGRVQFSSVVAELFNEVLPTLPIDPNLKTSENVPGPLHNLMKLTSTIVKNNAVLILSALAELCLQNYPDMVLVLKRYSWIESSKVFATQNESGKWQELLLSVKNFLKYQDPILGRINYALESLRPLLINIEEILGKITEHPNCTESLKDELKQAAKISSNLDRYEKMESILQEFDDREKKSTSLSSEMKIFLQLVQQAIDISKGCLIRIRREEETKNKVEMIISNVVNDSHCPDDLKTKIKQLKSLSLEVRIATAIRAFEAHEEKTMKNVEYFYLLSLQRCLEQICHSGHLAKNFLSKLLLKFFDRIDHDAFPSDDIRANIERYITQGNFYQALHFISKSASSKLDFRIMQEFQLLKGIAGEDFLVNMIRKMGNTLSHPKLWKCSKFVFLLRKGLTNLKVMREFQHACKNFEDFQFLPDDISRMLQMHNSFQQSDNAIGNLPEDTHWEDVDAFLQDLQRFAVGDIVPKDLCNILRKNILQSKDFKDSLRLADSLLYWNEEINCFTEPWDGETIRQAIYNIMKWVDSKDEPLTTEVDLTVTKNESVFQNLSQQKRFSGRWSFMNDFKPHFNQFDLLPRESIFQRNRKFRDNFTELLQYGIQSLRITSQSVIFDHSSESIESGKNGRPGMFIFPGEEEDDKENSINFMEIMACLLGCDTEPIYLTEICHSLSIFNKPLPLVIPNFRDLSNSFHHTLQILNKLPMQTNSQKEYLFENPFNCILCLQVGNFANTTNPIQILNTLLKPSSHLFSGANPIPGYTELVGLTVGTCSTNIAEEISKSNRTRTPILIAVHGNCLEVTDLITVLKPLCSSAILFYPPGEKTEMKEKYKKISPLLGSDVLVNVFVGNTPENTLEKHIFKTSDSESISQSKLLVIIGEVLEMAKKSKIFNVMDPNWSCSRERISPLPSSKTIASVKLMAIIQKLSCKSTKQLLNKCDPNAKYFSEIISLVVSILTSEKSVVEKAIHHLEYEMNNLVEKEGRSTWKSMKKLEEKLNVIQDDTEISVLQKEYTDSLSNLQACRLTLNDFLATLEKNIVPEDTKSICFENVASYIFNSGSVFNVELENMFILKNILPHFDKINLSGRFQVVSFLGNDNDTMVNSIFNTSSISNQNFTVGTTKLDFRFVKLHEKLINSRFCEDLLTEQFLIINFQMSNGHQTEINAKEELKVAALILAVSNLVLLKVKDPEVIKRLEISFLDACKLNSGTNPDFILINEDDSAQAKQDFKKDIWNTIKNVSQVSNSHKFNLGIVEDPLTKFAHIQGCQVITVKISDVGFKYDDIRLLRKSILGRCEEFDLFDTRLSTAGFPAWLQIFLDSWVKLQDLSHSSEFNSCRDILEFQKLQLVIDDFKDSVDSAFRSHRQSIETEMKEQNGSIQGETLRPMIISSLQNTIANCQMSNCSECKRVISIEDKLSELLDGSILSKYIKDIQETSFQQLLQKLTVAWKIKTENNQNKIENNQAKIEKNEAYSQRFLVSPTRRFVAEMKIEYKYILDWVTQQLKSNDLPVLSNIDAYPKIVSNAEQKRVSWEQEDWLETEIEDAIKFVYIDSDEEIYQIGMVRQLKKKVCNILARFESGFGEQTLLHFQWTVHVFALKSFLKSIEIKQRKWDKDFDLVSILADKT